MNKSMSLRPAHPQPEIIEAYRNYVPSCNVKRIVKTLLRYVPPEYLLGLRSIVLTNSSGLSRNRRRRKTWSRHHKVRIAESWEITHMRRGIWRPAYTSWWTMSLIVFRDLLGTLRHFGTCFSPMFCITKWATTFTRHGVPSIAIKKMWRKPGAPNSPGASFR